MITSFFLFFSVIIQYSPSIRVDLNKLSYGEMLSGSNKVLELNISNNGSKNLILYKIESSCACNVSNITFPNNRVISLSDLCDKTPIGELKPKEKASLKIQLNSIGLSGYIKKRLFIYSNDPNCNKLTIPITAKVNPGLVFEPNFIDFGTVHQKSNIHKSLKIRSKNIGDLTINKIKNIPNFLNITYNSINKTESFEVIFDIELKQNAPLGSFHYRLPIIIKNPKINESALVVFGKIIPPIIFKSNSKEINDSLNIGMIPKGVSHVKLIEIKNNDNIPYNITNVDIESRYSNNYKVEIISIIPGFHYKLKLHIIYSVKLRHIRAIINIHSDYPYLKTKKINIRGWFRKAKSYKKIK